MVIPTRRTLLSPWHQTTYRHTPDARSEFTFLNPLPASGSDYDVGDLSVAGISFCHGATAGAKHGRGVRLIMWHTSRGDRTLVGAEGLLVGHAIETMIDNLLMHYDEDIDDESAFQCESGIAAFDSLSTSQRLALLYDIARHLLTPTESALPLSATAEAAVAAIFVEIRDQVAIEIGLLRDGEPPEDQDAVWRTLVLSAHRSVFGEACAPDLDDGTIRRPSVDSRDMHAWEDIIEHLTDAVLWDRDFEMADSFLDVDPGVSQQRRRLLGIDDEYFTRVAPDPQPEELLNLVSRTRDIVRRKPR